MHRSTIIRLVRIALAITAFSGIAVRPARAAVIQAATCNVTDVANAVASAVDGDTVRIPAGNCSWSTGLSINKGITLSGAGEGLTTIQDNVSKGGSTCTGG